MILGKEIAEKHIDIFSSILEESDVPVPSGWSSEVTDSIEVPFSEKLMMFHITALTAASLNAYGFALANCMRSDLSLSYARLMTDIGKFSKDGAELMIENSWMEEIPETSNRKKLLNV